MKQAPLLLMLALGCEPNTASPPAMHPEPRPTATSGAGEVTRVLVRDVDPDPAAVQQALDTVIQIPVTPLGRQNMTVRAEPFRDLVVFRTDGNDYCRAHRPDADCSSTRGVTWDMQEPLGVAIIEFENPMAPRVMGYRFLGCPDSLPLSLEHPGSTFERASIGIRYNQVSLESLSASDVDGDGREEYILIAWHTKLGEEFEADGEPFEESKHRHIFVLRDDLTFEADGVLHKEWSGFSPAWAMSNDMLFENYSFRAPTDTEPAAIVMEWCEVDHYWDACSLDILCPSPNRRAVVEYDKAMDAFSKVASDVVLRDTDPDLACD